MPFLNESGLSYFWGKIKTTLAGKSDIGHTHTIADITNLQTTITNLTNRVTALENEMSNKQDKVYSWGSLVDGTVVDVSEEGA